MAIINYERGEFLRFSSKDQFYAKTDRVRAIAFCRKFQFHFENQFPISSYLNFARLTVESSAS